MEESEQDDLDEISNLVEVACAMSLNARTQAEHVAAAAKRAEAIRMLNQIDSYTAQLRKRLRQATRRKATNSSRDKVQLS